MATPNQPGRDQIIQGPDGNVTIVEPNGKVQGVSAGGASQTTPSHEASHPKINSQPAQKSFWDRVVDFMSPKPDKNGNITTYNPDGMTQTVYHSDRSGKHITSVDINTPMGTTHIGPDKHHHHHPGGHRRHFHKNAVTPSADVPAGLDPSRVVTSEPLPDLPPAPKAVEYQNGSVHYSVTQAQDGNFHLTTRESSGRVLENNVTPEYLKAISQGQAGMGGFVKQLDNTFPGHNFTADTKAVASRQMAPSL